MVLFLALNQYRIILPKPEDVHCTFTIGNLKVIDDTLEALKHTIKSCLTTYSNRLDQSAWVIVSFTLIRIATFAQLLADFHRNTSLTAPYLDGFHANELGYVVIGTLRMSALTMYNKRMVLPSIDAYSAPLNGEHKALFDQLRWLFEVNLECAQVETMEWLHANVSLQIVTVFESLNEICWIV